MVINDKLTEKDDFFFVESSGERFVIPGLNVLHIWLLREGLPVRFSGNGSETYLVTCPGFFYQGADDNKTYVCKAACLSAGTRNSCCTDRQESNCPVKDKGYH